MFSNQPEAVLDSASATAEVVVVVSWLWRCPAAECGQVAFAQRTHVLVVNPLESLITLGRRFGRYAYPNEFQKAVIDKIAAALRKLAGDANFERVLNSAIFYGVRYTEENAHYSLLVLLDPVTKKVGDDRLDTTLKRLIGFLAAAGKETGYSPEVDFVSADLCPASKLLAYSPFDPGP